MMAMMAVQDGKVAKEDKKESNHEAKEDDKSQASSAASSSKRRKRVKISTRERPYPKTPYRICEPSEEEDPTGMGRRVWEAIIKALKETDGSMVTAEEVIAQGGVHMIDGSQVLTMDHINKYIHQSYHTSIPPYQRKIMYKQSPNEHWLFVVPDWLNQHFY